MCGQLIPQSSQLSYKLHFTKLLFKSKSLINEKGHTMVAAMDDLNGNAEESWEGGKEGT